MSAELTATSLPTTAVITGPDRFRRNLGDLTALSDSITLLGLLSPIVVTPNSDGEYVLVCGERRLAAVRSLGWTEVPARVLSHLDPQEIARAERDDNTLHLPLTVEELNAAALRLAPAIDAELIRRTEAGEPARRDEVTAEIVGSSPHAVRAANRVEAAKSDPDPDVRERAEHAATVTAGRASDAALATPLTPEQVLVARVRQAARTLQAALANLAETVGHDRTELQTELAPLHATLTDYQSGPGPQPAPTPAAAATPDDDVKETFSDTDIRPALRRFVTQTQSEFVTDFKDQRAIRRWADILSNLQSVVRRESGNLRRANPDTSRTWRPANFPQPIPGPRTEIAATIGQPDFLTNFTLPATAPGLETERLWQLLSQADSQCDRLLTALKTRYPTELVLHR